MWEGRQACLDAPTLGERPEGCSGPSSGSLSERYVWDEPSGAEEEFSAALADLANTHPQYVSENQSYEVFLKGRALVPIELDHVRRVLTTMSQGEAHASHLATQTLANKVIARRAAYLDCSGLRLWIQCALMALPVKSSKLFAGKVQEARLWDAEDEVGQRKVFPKPSSCGYHKQQTSSKGKSPGAGKSSASASQAKQSKPNPPPHTSKDSGSFKHGGCSSYRGGRRGGRS